MSWCKIACTVNELRLDITLACGQSFRWHETAPGEWTGVLAGKVWTLSQDDTHIFYKILGPTSIKDKQKLCQKKLKNIKKAEGHVVTKYQKTVKDNGEDLNVFKKDPEPNVKIDSAGADGDLLLSCDNEEILRNYFQLNVNIEELYHKWSSADENFKYVAGSFNGVRMLRQDPVENLFSFICSSNNNIARITSMVERMSHAYGQKLFDSDSKAYHSFPTIESLAATGVEETLRGLGFGYRAKFISQSACYIAENYSTGWLYGLREKPYEEAKAELMKLCGVGAKVADCVCLMSLDKPGAIPVDTHVWQIAARDYLPSLKQTKSLTDTTYKLIGDHFRGLYGEYAGWAHSVLFSADLKRFKDKSKVKDKKAEKRNAEEYSTKSVIEGGKKRKR